MYNVYIRLHKYKHVSLFSIPCHETPDVDSKTLQQTYCTSFESCGPLLIDGVEVARYLWFRLALTSTPMACLAESQYIGDAIARSWCWWSLTRFRGHDQSRAMQLFGLNMFDPKVTSIWFYIFFKHVQAFSFILWSFVWCFVHRVQSAHLFFQVTSHVPLGREKQHKWSKDEICSNLSIRSARLHPVPEGTAPQLLWCLRSC